MLDTSLISANLRQWVRLSYVEFPEMQQIVDTRYLEGYEVVLSDTDSFQNSSDYNFFSVI